MINWEIETVARRLHKPLCTINLGNILERKSHKKKLTISLVILILIGYLNWYTRDFVDQILYDIFTENQYVGDKASIDRILNGFEQVKIANLPKEYKEYSLQDEKVYQGLLRNFKYYQLSKKEVYRKIVGHVRIKDLISRDKIYRTNFLFTQEKMYWGIDRRILYKVLELQDLLENQGYNRDGFWIRNGHRHPKYNEEVGGALKSRHIKGEAVDLVIQDINRDGEYTELDKKIVLKLCEEKVIGPQGGIGKYPGTRTIHIDVRGKRARWNSY